MFDLALSCLLFVPPALTAPMRGFVPAVEGDPAAHANNAATPDEDTSGATHVDSPSAVDKPARDTAFRRYFSRPLAPSARFLDHGVLEVGSGMGFPSIYRWQLQLGLFDYFTGGVSMHWLEGQSRPHVVPQGAVALLRRPSIEFGASYRQVLHTPQEVVDAGFVLRTHYIFGTAAFSRGPWSAGVEVGAVRFRGDSIDPLADPEVYRWRTLAAGGLYTRFGTRRWGVTVQGQMPVWTLELMLDLRFGLFELRERGGWKLEPR